MKKYRLEQSREQADILYDKLSQAFSVIGSNEKQTLEDKLNKDLANKVSIKDENNNLIKKEDLGEYLFRLQRIESDIDEILKKYRLEQSREQEYLSSLKKSINRMIHHIIKNLISYMINYLKLFLL